MENNLGGMLRALQLLQCGYLETLVSLSFLVFTLAPWPVTSRELSTGVRHTKIVFQAVSYAFVVLHPGEGHGAREEDPDGAESNHPAGRHCAGLHHRQLGLLYPPRQCWQGWGRLKDGGCGQGCPADVTAGGEIVLLCGFLWFRFCTFYLLYLRLSIMDLTQYLSQSQVCLLFRLSTWKHSCLEMDGTL